MRIAFYAPLKPPDHPVPSGDRRMARLLIAALERAGHEVAVASRLRSYAIEGSAAAQEAIRADGEAGARRLIAGWRDDPATRPDLWFTYHLYYRAPDWIGPEVARALAIPYVVAEASFAMKRAAGVWAPGHAAAERALSEANLIFSLSGRDRPGLLEVPGLGAAIVDLAPFVDVAAGAVAQRPRNDPPVLLAVAMMRARAKVESYRILARALARLSRLDWRLAVAGDGPARGEVERSLANLGRERVDFLGAVGPDELGRVYAGADILVWPGFDEAYGMVYLEAQAAGLPVVAMDHGGVAGVVRDGVSGRLVAAGDLGAYVEALGELIADREMRERLGLSAREFIRRERSLEHAAGVIGEALDALVRAV